MKKQEFDETLKKIGLSRQEFADMTELAYSTIGNWHDEKKPVPGWVKSWLDNYVKAKENEKIRLALKPLVDIELRKKEISNLLDSLLQLGDSELISIFAKEAPTISDRLFKLKENGSKLTKKFLAYEIEGLTMAHEGTYEYTFEKIKEITGVLLKNSDTDLLFDFLR